jgi:ABC-2 type transport system permease protein
MTWVETKLFMREPIGVFFTLAFPLLVLFVFGAMWGNEPARQLGNRGSVDVSTPGYIALIIGTVGLLGLPIGLAAYREQGVLRRLRATPVPPATIVGAQLVVNLGMATAGAALLVVVARLVYGLRLPEAPAQVALGFALAALAFCAVGFVLGSLLPTARTAQIVGMALLYPMIFLSGSATPRQLFPSGLRTFSEFLPLTHVTVLLDDLWTGKGWNLVSLGALGAVLVLGVATAAKVFRYE